MRGGLTNRTTKTSNTGIRRRQTTAAKIHFTGRDDLTFFQPDVVPRLDIQLIVNRAEIVTDLEKFRRKDVMTRRASVTGYKGAASLVSSCDHRHRDRKSRTRFQLPELQDDDTPNNT